MWYILIFGGILGCISFIIFKQTSVNKHNILRSITEHIKDYETLDELNNRSITELRQIYSDINSQQVSTTQHSTTLNNLHSFTSDEIEMQQGNITEIESLPETEETESLVENVIEIDNYTEPVLIEHPEPILSVSETNTITMQDVDRMGGWGFENFIAKMLRQNGFEDVSTTEYTGDYGVDVCAKKDGKLYAIQCKCYTTSNIGVKAIQEAYSGKGFYHADIAVVATNSNFTQNALIMANQLEVIVWDRQKIKELFNIPENPKFTTRNNTSNCNLNISVSNQIISQNEHNITHHTRLITGDGTMTRIGAGTYIFGEDLPLGKYDLIAISGEGTLEIQNREDGIDHWINFGTERHCASSYKNLSLPQGWHFKISGSVIAEIKKSKMLEID